MGIDEGTTVAAAAALAEVAVVGVPAILSLNSLKEKVYLRFIKTFGSLTNIRL